MLPADHPDIALKIFNLATDLTPPASYWFALEALQVFQSKPFVIHVSDFIARLTARHAAASMQPPPPPSSPHLRIGRLVRLHGLSACTRARAQRQAGAGVRTGTERASGGAAGGGEL